MPSASRFFITGTKGFETALFHELRDIVAAVEDKRVRKVYGGVELEGGMELAYRVCLHSRLANRVYLQLSSFKAESEQALYEQVLAIDWQRHLTTRNSLAVSVSLSRSSIDHSHYAALKVKDAVVDYFRHRTGGRPSIEKAQPDIHIHVNVHKNNAVLSLDLSGQSLHRRGYRTQHSGAPLKENLAAALLWQAGWNRESAKSHSLVDPMCGSGTFAIEAAMIAANIAPGLDREYFGFVRWLQHDKGLWQALLSEAEGDIEEQTNCEICASDNDQRAIDIARDNALRAGVEDLIEFTQLDILELTPEMIGRKPIFILNPPYGERLQAEQGLATLYSQMGRVFRQFADATVHIISANPDLLHRLRLNRTAKKSVNNGQLACVFASFEISEHPAKDDATEKNVDISRVQVDAGNSKEASALRNRLSKNHKHLSRWARRNGVSCYRLYDADLPEFAFALDVYTNALNPDECWYLLQEYQAPKTVDPDKAQFRIQLAQTVILQLFDLPDNALYCRTRQRQRGHQQYQKQDRQGELFQVREGDARLLINLTDYLDSGLFLDHRLTRTLVRDEAAGKALLNLFCYTGSVSVQAALGGAERVISADMSATYLNWAQENFAINDLDDEQRYRFIQADCLDLLKRPRQYSISERFDLIFLDPPSFSNSKRMHDTLDVQRDHADMIRQAMKLLNADGTLWFSTNRKGFRLDQSLVEQFAVSDITARTIPEDFKRRPKIHQVWEITLSTPQHSERQKSRY